jgi:hypothetical protein
METENEPLMIFAYIIAFFIAIAITRLVFSIPTIVRHIKAQTKFQELIARKAGATDLEVMDILSEISKYH